MALWFLCYILGEKKNAGPLVHHCVPEWPCHFTSQSLLCPGPRPDFRSHLGDRVKCQTLAQIPSSSWWLKSLCHNESNPFCLDSQPRPLKNNSIASLRNSPGIPKISQPPRGDPTKGWHESKEKNVFKKRRKVLWETPIITEIVYTTL